MTIFPKPFLHPISLNCGVEWFRFAVKRVLAASLEVVMSFSNQLEGSDYTFICGCKEDARSACAEQPYNKYRGKPYCVFHYPGKEKASDFEKALQVKLDSKDFNFRGVWFPYETPFEGFLFTEEADFTGATFSTIANFKKAKFSKNARFSNATFTEGANYFRADFDALAGFMDAKFIAEADFSYDKFSRGADFDSAFGREANFNYATFNGEAYFRYATFKNKVNLRSATFGDHVRFGQKEFGEHSSLDLQYARIEKPDHVSFDSLTLHPHWFVNVDPRKFDFINIEWKRQTIEQEIDNLRKMMEPTKKKDKLSSYRLLARTYRQLAVNAEENNRYDEASDFRYRSMELWRIDKQHHSFNAMVGCLYWLASGYGERIGKALLVLSAIWVTFAIGYVLTGHIQIHRWYDIFNAFTYSLGVITLQKPEPKSTGILTSALITLEMILGPLQAALLALAIRRKFMR